MAKLGSAPATRNCSSPNSKRRPCGKRPARTEEIALPIAAIRRYLECPLQGAARYSLGMLEDEDAPEEAEDEPIEQSRLESHGHAAQCFLARRRQARRDRRRVRARSFESRRPTATHPPDSSRRPLQRPTFGASRMDRAGFRSRRERFRQWKDIRIGRADEFADTGEILAPIALNARSSPSRRNDSDAARESLRHDSRRFAGGRRCDQLRAAQERQAEGFSSVVSERNCSCRYRRETAGQHFAQS